jgi:hypothetical protein
MRINIIIVCSICAQNIPLHILTNSTAVLTEKLITPQIPKKFPAFYETRSFITFFKTARHFYGRLIQSTPTQPFILRSILILSSHLCLNLPSYPLPSVSHPKRLHALLSLRTYQMPCPCHYSRFNHPHISSSYFIGTK